MTDTKLYSEFIHKSRYARWLEEEKRRETWEETVARYIDFFAGRFPDHEKEIRELTPYILKHKVMPSMRCLMTAGRALEKDEISGFNCSYVAIDHSKAFDEILYVLMCGVGVGYSVERQYVSKLPEVAEEFYDSESVIVVPDSKIGWATSFRELVSLLYSGKVPKWDLSRLRPAGARLKTFGGRSSGPDPLDELFHFTVSIFKNAAGRRLNSIECHDLVCKIADIVVCGGVRRCLPSSARISTPTGITTMGDIKVGDEIESIGRKSKVVSKVFSGTQSLLEVSHRFGVTKMTPNHRIAVFTSPTEYAFKEAKYLEPGDRLVWDRRSPVDFTYAPEWALAYRNRATTWVTALDRGLVTEDQGFSPTPVLAISEAPSEDTWDIEVLDIHEFTADGLITHNSALLSLSNVSDDRMRAAKSGQWWNTAPHRQLANNSACYTERPELAVFLKEWQSLYESKSGERGVFSRYAAREKIEKIGRRDPEYDWGCNPCSEILLRSAQVCNLSEAVIRPKDTLKDLKDKVRVASILGTLQSSLTNFRYLRKIWQRNTEEERLLGVSLTGIMDHTVMSCEDDPSKTARWLESLKKVAIETNKEWAAKLGIPESAAISTVKPSGTVSQLVNSASGIHARFSPYYIRRVRADKKDPLCRFMIEAGFPGEQDKMNKSAWVFEFPIRSPEASKTVDDMPALKQLAVWKVYQDHWCEHKPSCTVYYTDDDFVHVGAWVWENFSEVSGVSFLPKLDHVYVQAPYEAINEKEYKSLVSKMPDSISWDELAKYESEDNTTSSKELQCSGGACEVVDLV